MLILKPEKMAISAVLPFEIAHPAISRSYQRTNRLYAAE